jgi:hypothetical protein
VKLKPRASRLFIPTVLLAAISFALAYFADQLSPSNYNLALIAGAVVAGGFWAIPLLSHFLQYLELTNQFLIYRFGFLGLRKRTLRLSELSSIEIQRQKGFSGKAISIYSVSGEEILIRGYARTKLLAAEIEAWASRV